MVRPGLRARGKELAASQGNALLVALALLPDARSFPLLPQALVTADLAPIYGRPPDARLPGA